MHAWKKVQPPSFKKISSQGPVLDCTTPSSKAHEAVFTDLMPVGTSASLDKCSANPTTEQAYSYLSGTHSALTKWTAKRHAAEERASMIRAMQERNKRGLLSESEKVFLAERMAEQAPNMKPVSSNDFCLVM